MTARPSLSLVFRVWLAIGLQSFGGGATTFVLIRRAVVEQHRWIDDAEFTRFWSLCLLTPGVNLLALTVLIGRRLRGPLGIAATLAGLLLPTVSITIAMTAAYARIRDTEIVRAALRGVIPATVGLGVVASVHMGRPPLAQSKREGIGSLVASVAVLAVAALAVLVAKLPIPLVLIASGVTLAIVHGVRAQLARERAS